MDMNAKEIMGDLIKQGLAKKNEKGELEITKKGLEEGGHMMATESGIQYLKQVAKSGMREPLREDNIKEVLDTVDNTTLNLYEIFGVPENDSLRNYQVFCKLVESVANKDKKEKTRVGFEGMFNMLKEAKYFEVPDNINFLLMNTSNKVRQVKFPYYYCFLDTKLIVYDRTYYGFMVSDMNNLKEAARKAKLDVSKIPDGINVLTFYDSQETGFGWNKIELYDKDRDKYRNKIREYLINFVDFINTEDVRISLSERTEKNTERRVKRGRVPIPSYNKIYVVGYLQKYLNKLESQEQNTKFSHRFWVKGHFRHFWNKKYDNLYKQYKKGELKSTEGKQYVWDKSNGSLKIWIMPFIKGEGILVNKKYKLK